MKSEHRRKLQQNLLADWLANRIESAKPHQNTIVISLLLFVLIICGYTTWTRMSAAANTQAWNEFNSAVQTSNPAKLEDVTKAFPKTTPAYMAAVMLGDMSLSGGCDKLFVNKAIANTELTKASENYDVVLRECRDSQILHRATFGMARTKETKGELEAAANLYREVTTKWPDGVYSQAAAQRLKDIESSGTKEFYDRFAKFDPKPVFSKDTGDKATQDAGGKSTDTPASVSDMKLDDGKDAKPADAEKPAEPATPPATESPAKDAAPAADPGK